MATMTPEQRKANAELRKAQKLAAETAKQQQREAEAAEWETRKELEWYKSFFQVLQLDAYLRAMIDSRYETYEESEFYREHRYALEDLTTDVQNETLYLPYEGKVTKETFTQLKSSLVMDYVKSMYEYAEEYQENKRLEKLEQERKEQVRKNALSKLTDEEKKLLKL